MLGSEVTDSDVEVLVVANGSVVEVASVLVQLLVSMAVELL